MSKIMIAIPCMDQVPTPFAQSLAMIRKGPHDCAVAFQMGSLIYSSRNSLAVKAMQMEADYVMWFDSDMVFSQDTMLRMIKTLEDNNLDFLTGLYFRRVAPFSPVLFSGLEVNPEAGGCKWEEFDSLPDKLFEVAGCGFGCALVKTDVLFDVQIKFGTMFDPVSGLGEDLAFCWRARQMDYRIWCDPTLICGHVGYSVVNDQFYRSYLNAHKKEETDV